MEPHKFRSIPLAAVIKGWANQTNRNAPRTVSLALSRTCAIATKRPSYTVKNMRKFFSNPQCIKGLGNVTQRLIKNSHCTP